MADSIGETNVVQMFLVEGRELLAELEAGFLALEQGSGDSDPQLIHALFRAAHTIKGSAGIVGVDGLMRFTHHVETLMDLLRSGDLALSPDIVGVLLRSCDHMSTLLTLAEQGDYEAAGEEPASQALVRELARFTEQPGTIAADHAGIAPQDAVKGANPELVLIDFEADCLRNGFDPAGALGYLAQGAGQCDGRLLMQRIPALSQLDPESCHLAVGVRLAGVTHDAVQEAFSFFSPETRIVTTSGTLSPAERRKTLAPLLERIAIAQAGPWLDAGWLDEDDWNAGQPSVSEHAGPAAAGPVAAVVAESTPSSATKPAAPSGTAAQRFVKVPADRLDDLINEVGELVVAMAAVELQARMTRVGAMVESVSSVMSLIESIQSGALHLRMVPIGETFSRFHRVVRDLARELGKDVTLEIEGGETELDKAMVERLADPLMHLIRNSMDHGIESRDERARSGKSGHATLKLRAWHESGTVVIEASDDGRGLNRERILAKAVERGIVSGESTLSDSEVYQLIFEPGFSTAEAVTKLSGRGVGMDVVRSNIEALRGTIQLNSQPGQGTQTLMRLPLTLAVIDGFMVGVDKARLIIPLDSVVECVEMPADAADIAHPHYINLRGEVLPYVCMRTFFALSHSDHRRRSVVVVRNGNGKAGILVDSLHGEIQTVIKPLSRVFRHLKTISGTSILGTGDIALIIDVNQLLQAAIERDRPGGLMASLNG